MSTLGLALGGGGARGLAHISMLEVFDELGLSIDEISGNSVGAIIGVLYASGMKGADIREWVDELIITKSHVIHDLLHKKKALRSIEFVDISFQQSGLIKGERFTQLLRETIGDLSFDELKIPFKIATSDFWTAEQVVFDTGKVLPAVRASMGLPGVFTPHEMDSRLLIDGGGVNPLPHDLLSNNDTVVAIDVMGFPAEHDGKPPGLFRSVMGMFDIMQNTIIEQRLLHARPNLYIKPEIRGIDLLDFHMADQIYEQTEPAVEELRRWLIQWMESLES